MRKICLLTTLCLLFTSAFSQQEQPFFYRIFADDGLSSDRTTRVIQDHRGYIWIGTEEGLNKVFDYNKFEKYQFSPGDSTSLSDDYITSLYVDSRQRLWIGTNNGLNLYNEATNSFQRLIPKHGIGREDRMRINDIIEDENRDLWVICSGHLVKLDGESLEDTQVLQVGEEKPQLIRLALFESRLRVATSKGIYTVVDESLQKSGMAPNLPVTDLLAVENELWIGTASSGVLRYDAISGETKQYERNSEKGKLSSNHVSDLALIDGKEIWVSTINGVTALDIVTEEVRYFYHDFDNGFSLSDRVIRQTYQDRASNVWLTTPNSGVNYYHKADNLFGYYGQSVENGTSHDLMDYGITSILSRDNQAWLGSRKGISLLSNGVFEHYPFEENIQQWVTGVYAIEQDAKGQFWLGTNYQLYNWDARTGKYTSLAQKGLGGRKVNALALAGEVQLWIGTESDGLKILDLESKQLADVVLEPGNEDIAWPVIKSILPLTDRGVLVGTTKGLFFVNGGEIEKIWLGNAKGELSDELSISVLALDDKGDVLVGTRHNGLLLLNSALKAQYHVGSKEGLASQDVRSIVFGVDQSLWVSTNAGLSRLVRKGGKVTEVKNYDIQDGLQSNHFLERSAVQLANGKILMGGLSGLTIFHPNDVLDFNIEQNLDFVSLSINGKKVKVGEENSPLETDLSLTDRLILNPEQNHFTIEFNALDYTRPSDVTYRYRLKGQDSDWTELKEGNKVTFQNLAGGRQYALMVQSKGRFSDWSPTRELALYIKPYYYETVWFKGLAAVVVGVLVGFLLWLRAKRSALKKKALESLVAERSAALQEEVAIRRETEKKLKEALTEAERASEVKSQFLANMSHEIRTPLNGIMGMTELSLETDLDKEQHLMLDTIYKSTQSLRAIVNDILDIAKIEAGMLKIAHEKYSVRETLDQVMASFQLQANQKNLSLKHWVLPKVPGMVLGDAGRLRQVLVNLMANAMKFTHNGSITVIVDAMNKRATSMELWFTVTDTGIGIPEFQQENIFKSFMQVESGPSRAYGGTGLGLSISKELVEKMGGEIWVESEEGKGSIFSFYVRAEEFISDGKQVEKVESVTLPMEALPGKVLIVEDIVTNQLVTAKMTEKLGLSPTCVNSGREALKLLKEQHFDLVLMDLHMPEIDGLAITRLIKSSVIVNQNVPVVAITATASEEIKERCLAAGMSGYLAKPVLLKELYHTLRPLLMARKEGTV